ncbi:MAG: hypothetical protein ACLP0H_14575, partial [Terriglobales bacterium]
PVALTATVSGGPRNSGPRQRPRLAASSGSQTKAPGSAGGYLLKGNDQPKKIGTAIAESLASEAVAYW